MVYPGRTSASDATSVSRLIWTCICRNTNIHVNLRHHKEIPKIRTPWSSTEVSTDSFWKVTGPKVIVSPPFARISWRAFNLYKDMGSEYKSWRRGKRRCMMTHAPKNELDSTVRSSCLLTLSIRQAMGKHLPLAYRTANPPHNRLLGETRNYWYDV